MSDPVNHPEHYGGVDNPYECIKVIEAWGMGYQFCIGNAIKYLSRAGRKATNEIEDLRKAAWYLNRAIQIREKENGSHTADSDS